jgi:uncharacterized OB-fold protein
MGITDDSRVRLATVPSKIDVAAGGEWILHFPRFGEEGTHSACGQPHPLPGLSEGRLMATRCVNPRCPIGKGRSELWVPPRADCPDCHQPMVWEEVKDTRGCVYAYTYVERGGTGLEIECPYYQVDVKIAGVWTIVKSYLVNRRPIKIGDKVKAGFRTGAAATHTSLDLYFELI